jgi:hypothetical protein
MSHLSSVRDAASSSTRSPSCLQHPVRRLEPRCREGPLGRQRTPVLVVAARRRGVVACLAFVARHGGGRLEGFRPWPDTVCVVSKLLMRRSIVTSITILFLAELGSPSSLNAQAADFAFRFHVGNCSPSTFDTFKGEFTKTLGEQTITIPLSLPAAEMQSIFQAIERMRFFDYPSSFNGSTPRPSGTDAGIVAPANSYILEVRNGGVVHAVMWRDNTRPTTAEADRLRALFSLITETINQQPDVKRLPRPEGACL